MLSVTSQEYSRRLTLQLVLPQELSKKMNQHHSQFEAQKLAPQDKKRGLSLDQS